MENRNGTDYAQNYDLYRFAAYHFLGAKQWGAEVTDIILASGDVWAGKKEKRERTIVTRSGKYAPVIVDFTERDGRKRLAEIREAVRAGEFGNWLELVFMPLYGKYSGRARNLFVEEVLRFQSDLCKAGKISPGLFAAVSDLSVQRGKDIAPDRRGHVRHGQQGD